MSFFGEQGNQICAENCKDLKKKLSRLDINVPLRIEGRSTEHIERQDLVDFILTLESENLIQYPVCIQKTESPDFQIKFGDKVIGLEHCLATTRDREVSLRELETIEDTFSIVNGGRPLLGYEIEETFADIIIEILEKKNKKAEKYKKVTENLELLIYYNNYQCGLLDNLHIALKILKDNLNFSLSFNKVHIIIGSFLIYDALGDFRKFKIK
ncbi:MAG: hypothetical protein N2510_04690 [Ignavibacteria bacterium]|nr:hypothetical protein [Ignavibacteria bacterium]